MGSDRPTLDTVAREAGVSRMTVSNAYNRPDQLSAETRRRVLAAAARVGYAGPDPAAQSLRRGSTGTIGVVLTERLPYAFTDPGMVSLLHGIAAALNDAGSALLLVPSQGSRDQSLVRTAIADALVLCAVAPDDPAVTAAVARGLPLVTVGTPHLPGTPRVTVDNRRAAALAAEHLLALGHRRFAVVTQGPSAPDVPGHGAGLGFAERAAGFVDALRSAGVPDAGVTVVEVPAHDRRAAAAAVPAVLDAAAGRRPSAVFGVTDVLALGALDAITAAGLDVPGDVSVVGFDGIGETATSTPPLTTVDQALFEQGCTAARLALRRVAGGSVRGVRQAPRLVVRASTGPPPSARR